MDRASGMKPIEVEERVTNLRESEQAKYPPALKSG
jgi:hypothetical protein